MEIGYFEPENQEEAQEFLRFLRELSSSPGLSSESPGEAFLAVKAARKASEEARKAAAEAAAERSFLRKRVFGYIT